MSGSTHAALIQKPEPSTKGSDLAPQTQTQHSSGNQRPQDRRAPNDASHWLLGGAVAEPRIQSKPADAGYGDIIATSQRQVQRQAHCGAPGDDTLRWLLDGGEAKQPIQRKPIDPGYGDIVTATGAEMGTVRLVSGMQRNRETHRECANSKTESANVPTSGSKVVRTVQRAPRNENSFPGFSQWGDTCEAASVVSALMIWDKQNNDPSRPNNLLIKACNILLTYLHDNRPAIIAKLAEWKSGNSKIMFDADESKILLDADETDLTAVRDLAKAPGTKISEANYQTLGRIITLLYADKPTGISSTHELLTTLGIEGKSENSTTFDGIFDSPVLQGLAAGQIAQVVWYAKPRKPDVQGNVPLPHHAFLIGRFRSGGWFVSDQGSSPPAERVESTLSALKKTIAKLSDTGKSNILTGTPTAQPAGWTGVKLLGDGSGVDKVASNARAPVQQQPLATGYTDPPHRDTSAVTSAPSMPVATAISPPVFAKMEHALNANFSDVRVHPESARAVELGALAFTQGSDIHVAPGQWAPESTKAQQLLGHELGHVLQQRAGRVSATAQLKGVALNDEPALEAEADAIAALAMRGEGTRQQDTERSAVQRRADGPIQAAVDPGAPSGSGPAAPATKPAESDPDAKVSLGILDNRIFAAAAEQLLGPTQWTVMRELLRGIQGGLQSSPPQQQARIEAKAAALGFREAVDYAEGYGLGILEGLWSGLSGLAEAVVTLVKLPYEVNQFLAEKLPELAVKYGPRLIRFLTEGEGLSAKLRGILSDILKHPMDSLRALNTLIEGIKGMALAQVRALGHGIAEKILGSLEKPWFEYGRDVGKVVGRVLFEVILALASKAIANVVKEVLAIAARLSARLLEGAVELLHAMRQLLGSVLEWLRTLVSRMTGKLAEILKDLEAFFARLGNLLDELAGERALLGETGTGLRMPVPKGPTVLESRALKPPGGGAGPKVELEGAVAKPKELPAAGRLVEELGAFDDAIAQHILDEGKHFRGQSKEQLLELIKKVRAEGEMAQAGNGKAITRLRDIVLIDDPFTKGGTMFKPDRAVTDYIRKFLKENR